MSFRPIILLLLLTFLLSLPVISSAMATPAGDLEETNNQIGSLQAEAGELNSSYQQALTQLVAVDSEVDRYNTEIQATSQRRDEVQVEVQKEQKILEDLQAQLASRQGLLENRLRSTYKSDDVGYLEVILGAGDFNDFLNRVDMISLIADDDRRLIESVKDDQITVEAKIASLDQKHNEMADLLSELDSAQENLLGAQAEQQQVVSSIRAQMQNNDGQLAQLQAEADSITARMNEIQNASYASSSDGGGYSPPAAGGASLTATATAYCLGGRTATGMPVGRGIIAVDPDVIPLGSRVHVSGYGDAIAADTGGAIIGNKIDVWLTCDEAYAWGVRSVTVTVY